MVHCFRIDSSRISRSRWIQSIFRGGDDLSARFSRLRRHCSLRKDRWTRWALFTFLFRAEHQWPYPSIPWLHRTSSGRRCGKNARESVGKWHGPSPADLYRNNESFFVHYTWKKVSDVLLLFVFDKRIKLTTNQSKTNISEWNWRG
jgi:hypothetical protein